MRLGLNTGYWSAGPPKGAVESIQLADQLGFEHIWTAEAYGSDALTPLAWWGASTTNVKLGTAIMYTAIGALFVCVHTLHQAPPCSSLSLERKSPFTW